MIHRPGGFDLGVLVFAGIVLFTAATGMVTGGIMFVAVAGGLLVGGVLLLLTLWRGPFRASDPGPHADPAKRWPRTDAINMAGIRVAGIGGLGLVVLSIAVAHDFPVIGTLMTIALAAGTVVAVGVIVYRRRRGPLPSRSDERHVPRPS